MNWINVKADLPNRHYKLLKNVTADEYSIDFSADNGIIRPKKEGTVSLLKDAEIPLVDDPQLVAYLGIDKKKQVVANHGENFLVIPSKAVIMMDSPGQQRFASWINVESKNYQMSQEEQDDLARMKRKQLELHELDPDLLTPSQSQLLEILDEELLDEMLNQVRKDRAELVAKCPLLPEEIERLKNIKEEFYKAFEENENQRRSEIQRDGQYSTRQLDRENFANRVTNEVESAWLRRCPSGLSYLEKHYLHNNVFRPAVREYCRL